MHVLRRKNSGVSLVELLVGIAIGSVVIVGAVFVYSQSRTTYGMNETMARLQEHARFALAMIEPDVQLAGYLGFTNTPEDIHLFGNVPVDQMEQVDGPRPEVPVSAHQCGDNFALDVLTTVQGSNDAFVLGPNQQPACDPQGGGAQPNTDTLTIRRSGVQGVAPNATRVQVYTSRLGRSNHQIFVAGAAPGAIAPGLTEVRDFVVRTYYISQDSNGRPGFPALRVKNLGTDGANPVFNDFEVLPGVEDMQVQFGIDSDDFNGVATRYVDPDSPLLVANPRPQIVSVRIWLRVRSDQPDLGHQDGRNYQYAGVNWTPAGADRQWHRLLVSKTIQLRNARIL